MKPIFFICLLSFVLVGAGCTKTEVFEEVSLSEDPTTATVEVSHDAGITFEKEVHMTPDETYTYGAFCRVNYLARTDEFFVSFGGSNPNVLPSRASKETRTVGGAEGGNGYSYKMYSKDFEETGKDGVVHNGGGDAASVLVGDDYYFLSGGSLGWALEKIDTRTWEMTDRVDIATSEGEALNDQMLAYANGQLVASGLYDAAKASGQKKKIDPTQGSATHNRVFDTELNQLDYFILDDTPHINASSLLFTNGMYHYITSSAFFGDLIVMHYGEDWEYVGVNILEEGGQWPQGAVYDSVRERFYVAFLDLTSSSTSPEEPVNVALGVFDQDWSLIEKIMVTDLNAYENGGRPWVILEGDRLYVSYDVSTMQTNGEENKDWQCQVKIYELE